ncbi:YicC/YloC family endoribonuclease [Ruixingdingia sedimenti]|uniref:YicC/YloC family endoribonuclease n=1 Tax=Ruixingdingia sedimenti TaxID=3073604 RepID=A0ABU1F7X3_9RHOB|nr:YicC/YloC family endoribonuclease [Xinfangfangia sp. LG-4]MDR5652919.1 YicC/YloC family endoribonuclease [Xinfangfangia sp. LG-4]
MTALMSMTGFAARRGQGAGALAGLGWGWEVRSVNGKGLDLRLRLPEAIEGLETAARAEAARRIARGNVTLTLKISREGGGEGLRVNPAGLSSALAALAVVTAQAQAAGVTVAAPTAAEVLSLRGVAELGGAEDEDQTALCAALLADLGPVLDDFTAMRAAEGAALAGVIGGQLDAIAALVAAARVEAEARRDRMGDALRENLARVLGNSDGADPARVAQELALIAVKMDVTEELDRLDAHVAAARGLLGQGGPVGRKLDFLMQEFNREANTLCSKAQAVALTRIGLDLKHIIDQMREQVQNVE